MAGSRRMCPCVCASKMKDTDSEEELKEAFKSRSSIWMTARQKNTMFSLILHTIEGHAIEHAMTFLMAKGYTIESIIHGGFLTEQNSNPKLSLTEINKYVNSKNGLGLEFDWEKFAQNVSK